MMKHRRWNWPSQALLEDLHLAVMQYACRRCRRFENLIDWMT